MKLKDNGDVYAAKGWKKVASDLNIEILYVLLFTFVDHQTLKIKLVRTIQLSRVSSSVAIKYLQDESIHLVIFLVLYIFDKIKKYYILLLYSVKLCQPLPLHFFKHHFNLGGPDSKVFIQFGNHIH